MKLEIHPMAVAAPGKESKSIRDVARSSVLTVDDRLNKRERVENARRPHPTQLINALSNRMRGKLV